MIESKRKRASRGISPIIAVLLLIVIAVAASVTTYSWINWFLQAQQQQASSIIRIEQVDLSLITASGIVRIYVRNIGGVPVTVDAVYVNGTKWICDDVKIKPGDIGEIVAYKPLSIPPLKSGYTVEIKVATTAGTSDVYRGIIP
ncbi:MAG: hypothetical protein NDF53_02885 [archaeon GB-1867-097]|nr:hypothetical protein [Candidatus Culexmicrobium thermophilum]MCS7384660.1 hypothetical protein [Candidatus Culexmicrobium thermophilum]HDO20669.1 hypothetical protein [Candidatus Bathyarchaeota archaeon]